jgi:hypothetical protein
VSSLYEMGEIGRAILAGKNGGVGVGIVEVYNLK